VLARKAVSTEGFAPADEGDIVRTTPMRKLYFDIDGTVLALDTGIPKAALADCRS